MTAPRRGLVLPYTGPEGPRGPSKCKHHPAPDRTDGRGLDLAYHYKEVRSVVLGTFTRRCDAAGVDPDDLISRLYEAILTSNKGASAYDPGKASVMRYIHLVAASRFSHLAEQARNRSAEVVGLHSLGHDERDAAEVADEVVEGTVGADPAAVVERLLPAMARAARAEDHRVGDSAGTVFALFEDDDDDDHDDPLRQGWREQAVKWVVYEAVDVAEASGWWRCSVSESTRRMEWARARWVEALRSST